MKKNRPPASKNRFKIESTVVVAIIALVGTFIGYILESGNKRQQQQSEFESTLIIKAVETGNSEISKNNLKFLIDANLISDKAKQIKLNEIITDTTYRIYRGRPNSLHFDDSVYICLNSTATKYHFTKNCRALSECSSNIIKTSKVDANLKYNRTLCGWEK